MYNIITEDGMPAIQVRGGAERDEELATVGVSAGVGHRDDAGAGMFEIRMYLVVKLLAVNGGAAASCACWVTTLDHEIFYDPVELCAVVVAPVGKLGKVPACNGSMPPIHLKRDVSHSAKDYYFIIKNFSIDLNKKISSKRYRWSHNSRGLENYKRWLPRLIRYRHYCIFFQYPPLKAGRRTVIVASLGPCFGNPVLLLKLGQFTTHESRFDSKSCEL